MFQLAGQMFSGLIVGMVAKLILPGRPAGGLFMTVLFGLLGSIIGTFIGRAVSDSQNSAVGWIAAALGSLFALFVYRVAIGNRQSYEQSFFDHR